MPQRYDAESHFADYVKRVTLRLDHHSLARHAARVVAREALGGDLPLLRLRRAGLDVAALDILVALASGQASERSGLPPTVDSLVTMLEQADELALRAALSPDAPLVALGLVQIDGVVEVDERVIAALRGDASIDRRVRDVAAVHYTSPAVAIALPDTPGPIVIEGPARVGKTATAVASLGGAVVGDLEQLAAADDPCAALRRVRREAVLLGLPLVLRAGAWDEAWPAKLRRDALAMIQGRDATGRGDDRGGENRVILTVREGEVVCRQVRGPRRMTIAMPPREEQRRIWNVALADTVDVTEAIWRYPLPPGDILLAADAARAAAEVAGRAIGPDDITAAARARVCHRLGDVAELVSTTLSWSDLVLRDDVGARIRELIGAAQFRDRVMEEWGFAAKVPYGRSLSALFSGPPGTGKTMVASLIGKELGLEVFRVDLSKVVSKYIGETEKKLAQVFAEAARCNAVLLFDEADSLFAKRTDVKSSNDRYANLEVNFLLQRLESHEGIVILTTNAAKSIDAAFLRRLRYRVEFAEPDEHERAILWRSMMPAAAPVSADVDYTELGRRFRLTGGHIKNAVVRAAFLAMSEGRAAIDQPTLVRSATLEWTELGNLPEVSVAKRAPVEPYKPSIWEPAVKPPAPAPVVVLLDLEVEAHIARTLAAGPAPGETIEMSFRRKERELVAVFATLAPLEARALHGRLSGRGGHDDAVTRGFQRMSPERKQRLLAFLLDAPRREATKSRNRLAS